MTNLADRAGSAEDDLLAILEQLRAENKRLRQENADLKIALENTAEHGDLLELDLHNAKVTLEAEIAVRRKAEATLKALLETISRQKSDLEIIVQTLMEHGDILDTQWYQKFHEVNVQVGTDSLTQIANRRRFNNYLEQQWQQMLELHHPLSVIMCDIDAFKCYNDAYGHLAGDDCLKKIAVAFCKGLQRPGDLGARYGGEEFVALLPQTDLEGASIVAHRIQSSIRNLQLPHCASPVCSTVTVSMGLASTIPGAGETSSSLIQLADRRLYEAKRRGKNCIVSSNT